MKTIFSVSSFYSCFTSGDVFWFDLAWTLYACVFLGHQPQNLETPWWILPAEVLHGLTFAAMWSACSSYATSIAPGKHVLGIYPSCRTSIYAHTAHTAHTEITLLFVPHTTTMIECRIHAARLTWYYFMILLHTTGKWELKSRTSVLRRASCIYCWECRALLSVPQTVRLVLCWKTWTGFIHRHNDHSSTPRSLRPLTNETRFIE